MAILRRQNKRLLAKYKNEQKEQRTEELTEDGKGLCRLRKSYDKEIAPQYADWGPQSPLLARSIPSVGGEACTHGPRHLDPTLVPKPTIRERTLEMAPKQTLEPKPPLELRSLLLARVGSKQRKAWADVDLDSEPSEIAWQEVHLDNTPRENQRECQESESKPTEDDGTASIMVRHVACCYTQEQVVAILDELGLKGKYNFVHVPLNRKKTYNLGYFFVNFSAPEHAEECRAKVEGIVFGPSRTKKRCTVSVAHLQGRFHFARLYEPLSSEDLPRSPTLISCFVGEPRDA